jgi:16S rRNA (cytosine967-C5)-methyltransferase
MKEIHRLEAPQDCFWCSASETKRIRFLAQRRKGVLILVMSDVINNVRLLAVECLLEIFLRGARPKQSIESRSATMDKRDRAFLMEIVYGVLRYRETLDWILNNFLRKPSKLGDFTLDNLRIAAYQVLFMRVPDWAVVNESVEIEKACAEGNLSGRPALVNAVIRNVIRQKDRFVLPIRFDDPVTGIAVNTSHPLWLVRRWFARFGKEEATLLAEANNEVPPMVIRANTLRTTRDALLSLLAGNGVSASPTSFSPDGIIVREVRSYEDLSFARGLFVVQDEASQLISYLLGPGPGERVLDACAAPGGKTTHIAQLMKDEGEIVAVEKDPGRVGRLRENIETLGIRSVKIMNADVSDLKDPGLFDRILLDAPCSATGVIRRNPDVKYRHRRADLAGFRARQVALLRAVSAFLKENGRLVYSVCSMEPEEGEEVVKEFLKSADHFSIIEADVSFNGDFMDKGFFRTYPHRHTMDGFFGVSLCKKE